MNTTPALRVLVTGHHGYIGSVLAPGLSAAGHDVVGLDTFYYEGCDFGTAAEWEPSRALDVRDVQPSDLEGFDAVVHLAALSNDPVGDLNSSWTYDINESGSVKLALAAKEAGVGRFIFASSCSMYGAAGDDELVTEEAPLRPITAYAESKVRAEEAILGLAADGFAPVSMRNATAYGVSPRLRLDIVLNNLVAWAHTTGTVRLQSDGRAWRPLVHIRDIAKTTTALLEAPTESISGDAFNVGSIEQNYLIRTLAEIVQERLPHCSVEFAKGAAADSRSYRVDFSKLEARFPNNRLEWTAERGADELATAYAATGISAADLTGRRYLRLGTIKHLLEASLLDDNLRWTAAD
jgi:nucleoside-diphosphate-sugar epimerase